MSYHDDRLACEGCHWLYDDYDEAGNLLWCNWYPMGRPGDECRMHNEPAESRAEAGDGAAQSKLPGVSP